MVKKLYSITDWDYHDGKITWDDLVDEELNVIVTIATLSIAKEECVFDKAYVPASTTICLLSENGIWDIYSDVESFTVQGIQNALNKLGKLNGIKYQFTSEAPPNWEG